MLSLLLWITVAHADCPALTSPRIFEERPSDLAAFPLNAAYRAWVRARVEDVNPLSLLLRQRAIFARHLPDEVGIFDLVLGGQVGAIEPASCLEIALLEEHLRHGFETRRVTEFGAFVLECPATTGGAETSTAIEILFQSSLTASLAASDETLRRRDERLAQGCRLRAHLHNHPFAFDTSSGDIAGTTIPSEADRLYFDRLEREQGLVEARITNGFDVLIISSSAASAPARLLK